MSQYKLTYFNLRGRGEVARLLFAVAGQKYEDERIEFSKWPEIKASTPFGQMPVLEVDGVKLCQSKTIGRFLANRFGLAGKTDIEKALADMVVDCIDDTITPSGTIRRETDKAKQAELREAYTKKTLPENIAKLEKLLTQNKGGDGYFVGDSMTWADILWMDMHTWLVSNGLEPDLSSAPKLKALKERVEQHPKIAEWIKTRPHSDI